MRPESKLQRLVSTADLTAPIGIVATDYIGRPCSVEIRIENNEVVIVCEAPHEDGEVADQAEFRWNPRSWPEPGPLTDAQLEGDYDLGRVEFERWASEANRLVDAIGGLRCSVWEDGIVDEASPFLAARLREFLTRLAGLLEPTVYDFAGDEPDLDYARGVAEASWAYDRSLP